MKWLDEELMAYGASDAYPFHMPGHKRRWDEPMDPYRIDITEIDGFDNLHDASGLIRDLEGELAKIYRAKRSFLLVGGSTLGNLTSILSTVPRGGHILMARNCHKSVYHAMILGELHAHYVYPEPMDCGLQGAVRAEDVEAALGEQEEGGQDRIQAVVITSPTYEGVVSDIRAIADVAHAHGAVLIVDGAHGAHFGMHPYFPASMLDQGADAITMSLHKTLPCFTQTAVLHLPQGSRMDWRRTKRYLDMLETSSPSYILMAQAARCVRFLEEKRDAAFTAYALLLQSFYRRMKQLQALSVIRTDDPGKIVIATRGTSITGHDLSVILRRKYRLELEMDSMEYALAMTSVMDTAEGIDRLAEALLATDADLQQRVPLSCICEDLPDPSGQAGVQQTSKEQISASERAIDDTVLYAPREKILESWEALEMPYESVPLDQAAGRTARDAVFLYPPGIPVVNSGERITPEVVTCIREALIAGLDVIGAGRGIEVLEDCHG